MGGGAGRDFPASREGPRRRVTGPRRPTPRPAPSLANQRRARMPTPPLHPINRWQVLGPPHHPISSREPAPPRPLPRGQSAAVARQKAPAQRRWARSTSRLCNRSPGAGLGAPVAHRGEQLRSGDWGAVPVEFDAAAQVKVADLDGGDLRGVGRGPEAGVPHHPCPGRRGQLPSALTWLGCSHRMFSGFRSRWAMPAERTRASPREHFLGVPGQVERAPGGPAAPGDHPTHLCCAGSPGHWPRPAPPRWPPAR